MNIEELKQCDYCKENKMIFFKFIPASNDERIVDIQKNRLVMSICEGTEGIFEEDSIEISFCPFCGRKLEV